MSTDPHLGFAKIKYLAIKEKILGDNPDIDDQTLADTVEGLSNFPDKLAEILRGALDDEAMMWALNDRIERMKERRARFEAREIRRKAIVRELMLEAGLNKLTMPDFTASVGKGPVHLVVIDEEKIPSEFFQVFKQLDKRAVSAALKNGAQVNGAELSNPGMTLRVRTT